MARIEAARGQLGSARTHRPVAAADRTIGHRQPAGVQLPCSGCQRMTQRRAESPSEPHWRTRGTPRDPFASGIRACAFRADLAEGAHPVRSAERASKLLEIAWRTGPTRWPGVSAAAAHRCRGLLAQDRRGPSEFTRHTRACALAACRSSWRARCYAREVPGDARCVSWTPGRFCVSAQSASSEAWAPTLGCRVAGNSSLRAPEAADRYRNRWPASGADPAGTADRDARSAGGEQRRVSPPSRVPQDGRGASQPGSTASRDPLPVEHPQCCWREGSPTEPASPRSHRVMP